MSALLFIPWFKLEGLRIPGLPDWVAIQPFGILVALGVVSGMRVTNHRARRLGLKPEVISDFVGHVLTVGFICAHVFDRLAYDPEATLRHPWVLLYTWSGLSSYGGFGGAVLGAFIWKWRRGMGLTIPLDQVAFGLPTGWLLGRTGCWVVHDHPGKLTDFFLAVDNYHFPGLVVGPRHDLGLYEVLWSAIVIPLFFWLDRKPRPHGFFTALIAILYAPVRFELDFLREVDATYFGLTPAQYASMLSMVVGCVLMRRAYRQAGSDAAPELSASAVSY